MLHYSKTSDHKQEVMASPKYVGNGRSSHCNSGQASTAWVCDVCGFSFNGKIQIQILVSSVLLLVSMPQYTSGFCLSFNNIEI